jgi:hypothetical protein
MFTDLNSLFPNLAKSGYLRTSDPTTDYNCIAWVFGDDENRWEPDEAGFWIWPDGLKRSYSMSSFIKLFKHHGYEKCANGALEEGFQKVAIYTSRGKFKHVALQTYDGKWKSKLGDLDDIVHETLDGLNGERYGTPTVFLKKTI